jgi:hypothetical protein
MIFKKLYLISTSVLLAMLILASIISELTLNSTVFRIYYLIYAVILLISVLFIPGVTKKLMHLLLALLIGMSIYVKAVNDRFPVTLAPGGVYEVETALDTLNLELIDFTITHEQGSASAVHYESRIIVNGDKASVTVNHPFRKGKVRLYQSSYRTVTPFYFNSTDTLQLFEGQHALFNGIDLTCLEYDPILERIAIRYNDILFYLPVGRKTIFLDKEMLITSGEPTMATVLEYVEVKGHTSLLIIALSFLLVLIIDRVRRPEWN